MNKKLLLITLSSLFFISCTCSRKFGQKAEEAEEIHKRSYYLGVGLGRSVEKSQDIDEDQVLKGFKDGLTGADGIPSTEELQKFFLAEQQRKYQKQNAEAFRREQDATKFLEDSAKKEKLLLAGTGVFFKSLNDGVGQPPNVSDKIIVKYKGLLPDGTVFEDQSKKAVTLNLIETLPGWRVALAKFKKGAKVNLYMSPQNAYGLQGKGKVPSMSAVVFEIEILDVIRSHEKKIRI